MDERSARLLFGIFNIIVAASILADSFLLPQKTVTVKVNEKAIEESSDYRHGSHLTYFLIGQTGDKYNVSHKCHNVTAIGGSILVYKTFLFHKIVALDYYWDNSIIHTEIGVIISSYFGLGVCMSSLAFSILSVFSPRLFRNKQLPARLSLVFFWISVVIVNFYFLFQS